MALFKRVLKNLRVVNEENPYEYNNLHFVNMLHKQLTKKKNTDIYYIGDTANIYVKLQKS